MAPPNGSAPHSARGVLPVGCDARIGPFSFRFVDSMLEAQWRCWRPKWFFPEDEIGGNRIIAVARTLRRELRRVLSQAMNWGLVERNVAALVDPP